MSLKGDVADLIFGLPNFRQRTFDELAEVLQKRFGANTHVTHDRRMVYRRKEKGDSWAHLSQDIHKLAKRVYITSPHIAEREAKVCFIRALPEKLRLAIVTANPPTLRECIIKVEQMCAMMDVESHQDSIRVRFAEATSTPEPTSAKDEVSHNTDSPNNG